MVLIQLEVRINEMSGGRGVEVLFRARRGWG